MIRSTKPVGLRRGVVTVCIGNGQAVMLLLECVA
jgi:acetyl-CoA acetyltransferase